MANKAIVEWLRRYLKAGYTLPALKTTLLQHGYTKRNIDDAVRAIYGSVEVRHIVHLSKTTTALIVSIIFILILIAGGAFYLLAPKTPATLLDVSTELLTSSAAAGGKLEFNVELSSLGAAKRYDVDVRYDIIKDGNIITYKEETVGIETSKSYKTFIGILDDIQPGDYLLKTTASYDGKIARATSSFKVYKKSVIPTCYDGIRNQDEDGIDCGGPCEICPSCFDGIKNQGETGVDCGGPCSPCIIEPTECDDGNECTDDLLIDGECEFKAIIPCCGNGNCEEGEAGSCLADCPSDDPLEGMPYWEMIGAIEELAKTDDVKAAGYCADMEDDLYKDKCFGNTAKGSNKEIYCDEITYEQRKDECYITVAKRTNDHETCEKITSETIADRCYMHFATAESDYSVCDKVTDNYLKQLCNSMKSLEEGSTPT